MKQKVHIRFAKSEDLKAIRDLVIELAIFEKEPDAVKAQLIDYQVAFEEGLISMLVAETDQKIVGMTLFYDTFSTWRGKMLYLEDFVVNASFRSQGIGQLLYDATIAEAKIRNCTMIKWQVLDWNKGAINFYNRNKATIDKEWWNCKVIF